MAAEWPEVTVGQIRANVPNALATVPFGSSISSRYFQDLGVPVIRGSNLSEDVGQRLVHDDLAFVSEEKAREFRRSIARRGDLIFTCWGTIGQVGLIDRRCPFDEYIPSNKQMKFTPDPAIADSLFLYYMFSGPEVSVQIKNQAIGSSVPGFNLGQLRAIRFRLPPLREQQAIAGVIGALDDKIDLNRRMNQTLEAMAAALFKAWFVDFEAARVEDGDSEPEDGDATGVGLFPHSLADSAIGPVPEGWRVAPLPEVIEINPPRSLQRNEPALTWTCRTCRCRDTGHQVGLSDPSVQARSS